MKENTNDTKIKNTKIKFQNLKIKVYVKLDLSTDALNLFLITLLALKKQK